MKRAALGALVLVLATPVRATTYYVAQADGSDGYTGLYATYQGGTDGPFLTCQRAGDLMLAGDTVYVRTGSYTEPTPTDWWQGIHAVRNGTEASPITFRNYPGEAPVIDPEYQSAGLGKQGWGQEWVVFDGFKVIHGGVDHDGDVNPGSYFLVVNCHVSNVRAPASGAHANCIRLEAQVATVIRNCRLEDSHIVSGENANATTIMMYNTFDMIIENCDISDTRSGIFDKDSGQRNHFRRNVFHDTSSWGWLGPNQADTVAEYKYVYENIFYNTLGCFGQVVATDCYFYNNTMYRSGGMAMGANQRFEYWNNVIVDSHNTGGINAQGYFLSYWSPVEPSYMDYNCIYPQFRATLDVYGGWDTYNSLSAWQGRGHDPNSFVADPEFVNAGARDFHLQAGSPCRNAGVDGPGGTVDRDMGAYPFGTATVVGLIPSDAPTLRITTPTDTGSYATTNATVDLAGTASDNIAVTEVTWVNSGVGSGTASGTDAWSVTALPLQPGANVITVTAHDGEGNTGSDTVTVTYWTPAGNETPVADAGQDRNVNEGSPVALDGTGSYDSDAAPSSLTYAWTQSAGGAVSLAGADTATPSFTAGSEDTLTFLLTVSDGLASDTDEVTVSVLPIGADLPPIANAGADVLSAVGLFVTLDGSASYDPDGTIASWSWQQTGGTTVALAGASSSVATFTAPAEGTYTFRLTVSDGQATDTDDVTVTVQAAGANVPPVADAGPDQTAVVGATVYLNASASYDSNQDDTLSYLWLQVSGPTVALQSSDQPIAWFEASEPGSCSFRVTVSDGSLDSTDTAAVDVAEDSQAQEIPETRLLEVRPNLVRPGALGDAKVVGPSELSGAPARVFTMSGEPVGEIELHPGNGGAEADLDEEWQIGTGVYLVVVEHGGLLHRARFVVRR